MYDGSLGIITAIAAVKTLKVKGKLDSFPRPIEASLIIPSLDVKLEKENLTSLMDMPEDIYVYKV